MEVGATIGTKVIHATTGITIMMMDIGGPTITVASGDGSFWEFVAEL